jgi:flagellar biosynthetic protein FlhB
MADESEDQEKTEAATPRRLEKAREEGQVARSRELTTFVLLSAGFAGLWLMSSLLYGQLGQVMKAAFLFDRGQAFQTGAMLGQVWVLASAGLRALMPFFMLLLIVALGAPMLLGGWLFSFKALQPRFSKLNPFTGLARVFSSQALAELVKVVAKALLVGGIVGWYLYTRGGNFMALVRQPVSQALTGALQLLAGAVGYMVMGLMLVILLDVPWQLWQHAKKLRMSKEELKREHKESEGDPRVKGRIRSQQQAMARRRMMSKVPAADVIVTNPTHYAVALRYDDKRMAAPRVVAKGTDLVALKIREIAQQHSVPMLEAPPLARVLYRHVKLDREIPAALYAAVAEVLVWAFSLKRARTGGSAAMPAPSDIAVPPDLIEGLDEVGGATA